MKIVYVVGSTIEEVSNYLHALDILGYSVKSIHSYANRVTSASFGNKDSEGNVVYDIKYELKTIGMDERSFEGVNVDKVIFIGRLSKVLEALEYRLLLKQGLVYFK